MLNYQSRSLFDDVCSTFLPLTFKTHHTDKIKEALLQLKDRMGSSLPAIKKALRAKPTEFRFINAALRKGTESGFFIRNKGKWRLSPEAKAPPKKKKKVVKKKKKVVKKKKKKVVKKKKTTKKKKPAKKKKKATKKKVCDNSISFK